MASLERSGEKVNRKWVQPLMAKMGLEAFFPRSQTTTAAIDARVYPYVLRHRELTHAEERKRPHDLARPVGAGGYVAYTGLEKHSI